MSGGDRKWNENINKRERRAEREHQGVPVYIKCVNF